MERFNKYDVLGSYHWSWYESNIIDYRTQVDYTLSHFPSEGTILDAGCGDGLISYKLFKKGLSVHGIDSIKLAILLAKVMCRKHLDVGKLRFEKKSISSVKGTYDYVLMYHVIEHLKYPEIALKRIYNMISKYAIIVTPNANFFEPGKYDNIFYTEESMGILLSELGIPFEFLKVDHSLYIKLLKG